MHDLRNRPPLLVQQFQELRHTQHRARSSLHTAMQIQQLAMRPKRKEVRHYIYMNLIP